MYLHVRTNFTYETLGCEQEGTNGRRVQTKELT